MWVGKREVAHIDDDQALDVRLTKEVIRSRRSSLRADRRIVLRPNSSDWPELSDRIRGRHGVRPLARRGCDRGQPRQRWRQDLHPRVANFGEDDVSTDHKPAWWAGLVDMRIGPTVPPGAVPQIERMAPPSTGIMAPVTYDAAGESKKAATRPNSSGSPYLRSGMCSDCLARTSSGSPARASISRTRSVAIRTGNSPLIRTPAGPCSSARVFTTPASPGKRPFEMARFGSGARTDEANTKTRDAPVPLGRPVRSLPSSAARTCPRRTAPRKTLSKAARHASSVVLATLPVGVPPTLTSAPSMRPRPPSRLR